MRLGGFLSLNATNYRVDQSGRPPCSLFGTVQDSEVQWVHPQLLADFIDYRFDGVSTDGRSGRSICSALGLVVDHVIGVDVHIVYRVRRKHADRRSVHRRPRKRASLELEIGGSCGKYPFIGNAHLDLHVRA